MDTAETTAEQAPWERLDALERQIYKTVPPIDPPGCHWLREDSGTAYCWTCAREAVWAEMGREGKPPPEGESWKRSAIEEKIRDRIDGPSWGESDISEACSKCSRTLSHLLTDGGRENELAHFADNPIEDGDTIDGEQSYVLSRIFLNLTSPSAPPAKVAEAIRIAEDALSAIAAQKVGQPVD